MSGAPDVVVAGGGLAGLAAAVGLADRGARVTLVEAKKRLGGRATSLVDPRTGEEIDNCQHVAMGCCSAYLGFLERIGTLDRLEWTRDQWWVEAGGRRSRLAPTRLPPPLHGAPSFLGATFVSWSDKLAIARALASIRKANRADWEGRCFRDALDAWRQPASARRRFWEPVVISAINLTPERADAGRCLQVFQEGLLESAEAASIGVSKVPLASLYEHVEQAIRDGGGTVELGTAVTSIEERAVETRDGRRIDAARVVSALPFERLLAVASPDLCARDPRFAGIERLGHSPILGVHLRYDRAVLDIPHAVLVERPTQWLFRKQGDASTVHAVVSAADAWLGLTEDEIVDRVHADIAACFPAARGAGLVWARAIKEKRATFAATPEAEACRPAVEPPVPGGLLIAGDFTVTGWPATMEGAVRSGQRAAEAVLRPGGSDESEEPPVSAGK